MSSDIERLCGADGFATAAAQPALAPFDARAIAFLSDVSSALLRDPAAKGYPDLVTFAFFCRRANLERLRASYEGRLEGRLGRGLCFHIAPSNVPINFAYSLLAALLAGNASIVKASSLGFAQTRIVAGHMRQLLASSHAALTPYVNVIQYERDRQDVTEELSALCDARVIWGGDETVRRVRMAPLSPLAFEVTFGDRYSLLAVSAAHVLGMTDAELEKAAQGFYNDTYLYDQNACTTPRLVYWVGSGAEITLAKPRFWEAVRAYAATRYPIPAVMAVDKRMAVCRAALTLPGGARQSPMPDNVVTRVQVAELTDETEALRCAGGLFAEYDAQSLDALAPYVRRKFQTLSYLGLDPREIRAWALGKGLRGIDRIVPVGHTMDFSLTWDGYDLISTLSRVIDLPKEAR